MADLAPAPLTLREKLGFRRRKSSAPRKLVRKNVPQDIVDPHHVERRHTTTEIDPSPRISLDHPSSISDWESLSNTVDKYDKLRHYPTSPTKAPRKLSKLPHQIPVQMLLDKDTGERKDLTDMMHAFTFNEDIDMDEKAFRPQSPNYDPSRPDGTALLARASSDIWVSVADFLSPLDIANLSSTCKLMYSRLGRVPYKVLKDPANRSYRIDFLLAMDQKLPAYLFCFPCAKWHLRTHPGFEKLKPAGILNPLYICPNGTNNLIPPPRLRISEGRTLPFTFVQLAKRSAAYGRTYGIPITALARRWKDPYSEWSHESTYHYHSNGHVLMRIKSQVFVEGGMTPAAKRLLLFSRGDYTPYFSVCAHWREGILTTVPKCTVDHIPVPEYNALTKLRFHKAPGPVALCGHCRPMRRCPKCPTEYLFELKLVEDKNDHSGGPSRFKQALLVTRWSDLGPARSPEDKEWAASVGKLDSYDSFEEIGRRAISGVFESAFTDSLPGQRILSMNPEGVKADEEGGDWY